MFILNEPSEDKPDLQININAVCKSYIRPGEHIPKHVGDTDRKGKAISKSINLFDVPNNGHCTGQGMFS